MFEEDDTCPKCLGVGYVSVYVGNMGGSVPCPNCNEEEREERISPEKLKEIEEKYEYDSDIDEERLKEIDEEIKVGIKEILELSSDGEIDVDSFVTNRSDYIPRLLR